MPHVHLVTTERVSVVTKTEREVAKDFLLEYGSAVDVDRLLPALSDWSCWDGRTAPSWLDRCGDGAMAFCW